MAGFRQHVMFSAAIGAGYAFALDQFGFEPGHALIAGGLCGLAGMLPDLDSDTGTPIKEIFGLLAAVSSLFVFHRLRHAELSAADKIVLAAMCYFLVRFGVRWIFEKFTIHRGMWHSIPAGLLVSQLIFLAADDVLGDDNSLAIAGGVLIGFVSHLLLDEIWSFQFKGLLPSLKSSHGTALKLFSESKLATVITWSLLVLVSYRSAVSLGYAAELFPTVEQTKQATRTGLANLGVLKR